MFPCLFLSPLDSDLLRNTRVTDYSYNWEFETLSDSDIQRLIIKLKNMSRYASSFLRSKSYVDLESQVECTDWCERGKSDTKKKQICIGVTEDKIFTESVTSKRFLVEERRTVLVSILSKMMKNSTTVVRNLVDSSETLLISLIVPLKQISNKLSCLELHLPNQNSKQPSGHLSLHSNPIPS